MSTDKPDNAFDANLKGLLAESVSKARPDFEKRLEAAVLETVAAERRRLSPARRARFRILFAAAAAAVLVAWLAYQALTPFKAGAGKVRNVYGIVTVANGGPAEEVTGTVELVAGQRIATAWGSRAEIALRDKTVLAAGPKTLLSVSDTPGGFKLTLDEGYINVHAARQPEGKSLRVTTPGAEIYVLGTVFDVYVTDKNGAARKTEVAVRSGTVAVESGGRTVLLAPDMEATAAAGTPPMLRTSVDEVNELARLREATAERFGQSPAAALPSIIEVREDSSATAWLMLPARGTTSVVSINPAVTFGEVAAFAEDGLPLDVRVDGKTVTVSVPPLPAGAAPPGAIIVRLDSIRGLLVREGGVLRFERPAGGDSGHALLELRIPEAAWVVVHSSEPIERRNTAGRQVYVLDTGNAPLGILAPAAHTEGN